VHTNEGQTFQGTIVNLKGDSLTLNTDGTDPNRKVSIDRRKC
jgi:ribosome maturation factor RimP